jgi:lysine 2,3-aminomutase
MIYKRAEDISSSLGLDDEQVKELNDLLDQYPMLIPEYYYSLIDFNDPDDPIMKMSIPSSYEFDRDGSFDTSGEGDNTKLPGLQHKYAQTALILSTNKCAMYCRHCFRKRLVGLSTEEVVDHLGEIVAYIKEHEEISNVLISGGDSFVNSNSVIEKYLKALTDIPHLDFIRFGTRTPVVLPSRISEDKELLDLLKEYGNKKHLMVVTQFNHPKEITNEAKKAIKALLDVNVTVRNQTVLLGGVNDKPEILGQLFKSLTSIGISPYYLFQCRPVTGVKNNFQIPIRRGIEVVEAAKSMQNGLGKSFRYCLSHPRGKIEILGEMPDGQVAFKYHETKYIKDNGRIFTLDLDDDAGWLYDLD